MCSLFRDVASVLALMMLTSCQQGRDRADAVPPPGALVTRNRQSPLQPGQATPVPVRSVQNPYENNEEALADGKRLYNQMNCAGCHFAGGGGMGPPLMDDEWIYGSSSQHIFWTVIEGRPQGMPSFGGRISEDQVLRIAAYVRSLSGLNKKEQQEQGQQQGQEK